jgi:hypothetical protein
MSILSVDDAEEGDPDVVVAGDGGSVAVVDEDPPLGAENMLLGNCGALFVGATDGEPTGTDDDDDDDDAAAPVSGRYKVGGHLTVRVLCEALLTKAKYRPLPGAKTGCVGPDSPGGGSWATACAVHTAEAEEEEAAAAAAASPLSSSPNWCWPWLFTCPPFCDGKLNGGIAGL